MASVKAAAHKPASSKKIALFFILALLLGSAAVYYAGAQAEENYQTTLPVEKTVIVKQDGKKHTFNLEIASKPIDIQIGLMYREKMPKDHGMMFQMGKTPQVVSFWMKNTLIPLDMLFVAADGTIANIHRNAQPGSLTSVPSQLPVTAVIELNGGRADAVGLSIGDRVLHPYFGSAE